jgi:methylmalonyl-CoA/ethylmalonyl-CoA epimerase
MESAVTEPVRGPPPPGHSPLLTSVDHVGIACRDLAATVAWYSSTFGLVLAHRERNQEQGVSEAILEVPGAGPASAYLQLLEPLGPDTPVGRFLASRGEGIHHIGYRVADITAALASVGGAGVRLIDTRPRHGSMGASIAFLHPKDTGGVLTELVQPAQYRSKHDL